MDQNEPDRFRRLYKRKPAGPVHSSFSLLSLQRFRERSSATSLFFSVVFSDEHYDGGTVAAGGAAVPEPSFENLLRRCVRLGLVFMVLTLVFGNES